MSREDSNAYDPVRAFIANRLARLVDLRSAGDRDSSAAGIMSADAAGQDHGDRDGKIQHVPGSILQAAHRLTDLPESIHALLQAHRWDETVPRLVVYVRAQAGRLTWSGRRGGDMPQGKEPEDIVYGAIAKVLDGSRGWDPEREPDLERHLRSVCDSELNHLVVGFENRRVTRESSMTPAWADGEAARPLDTMISSPWPGPPDVLANREAESEAAQFSASLISFLSDDPPLQRAVILILDGTAKPADIAASLGMDITEVYNMRKRLQRRLPIFMARWQRRDAVQGGHS